MYANSANIYASTLEHIYTSTIYASTIENFVQVQRKVCKHD